MKHNNVIFKHFIYLKTKYVTSKWDYVVKLTFEEIVVFFFVLAWGISLMHHSWKLKMHLDQQSFGSLYVFCYIRLEKRQKTLSSYNLNNI